MFEAILMSILNVMALNDQPLVEVDSESPLKPHEFVDLNTAFF